MIISLLLIAGGFAALIFGAHWLVDASSSLAKKYKISDLAIGLTIVSFGTSAPELVVNMIAAAKGHSDIVLGNILGSNNFNLFIILGLSGIILPFKVQTSTAWKEIPISLFVSVLALLLLNDFRFSGQTYSGRIDAFIMLALFALFLYYVFNQLKHDPHVTTPGHQKSSIKIWGMILLGLAGLVAGGQLVVMNSIAIATELGVTEKIIGLTIIAAGTSLPELSTSIVAALKKNSEIAVGNIIGSNIFNLLFVLPLSSLIRPIAYHSKFNTDLYILIGGTLFLLAAMLTGQRKKLDRWEAGVLLAFYLTYIIYLVRDQHIF